MRLLNLQMSRLESDVVCNEFRNQGENFYVSYRAISIFDKAKAGKSSVGLPVSFCDKLHA